MPTSRRSAAVSRSDSLNALACAADVLRWSILSRAFAFKLPSASRRESNWARYSVCSDSAPSEM
eukprot:146232-Pleurochrysis_carterae.AAC.1